MKTLLVLMLLAVGISGCQQKDISSQLKPDKMAHAAKAFCNAKGENLTGFTHHDYNDSYELQCGGNWP